LFEAHQRGGPFLSESAALDDGADFPGELGLQQLFFGIIETEISEHIVASGRYARIAAHSLPPLT
jgi:hypothetical protein